MLPASSSGRPKAATGIKLIGIGASTGGPPVLQTILSGLPKDFPVPLLIVQHIARGFLPGMVDWLSQTTGLRVHIAAHGACPLHSTRCLGKIWMPVHALATGVGVV